MKVLVIGNGGREHALCWKLAQSPELEALYCAPGNPGTARLARSVDIRPDEIQQLVEFAQEEAIDLTVVGPELPLVLGLVDEFREADLAVFGPTRRAAELEGSKVFAKELMQRHGIPTADFEIAHDERSVLRAAKRIGLPVVLKAEGLAAGKGVLIVHDRQELEDALGVFFGQRRFGQAGDRIVVEEFLEGEEVSFIALCDGARILPLASSKDYKRIGENDEGPNTGGMGAHSPAGVASFHGREEIVKTGAAVMERIMHPVAAAMADDNRPFKGFLYAGLVETADGMKVLEFNVRLGDPEAQPLLMRLEDDLVPLLAAGARGDFGVDRLHFRKEAAACIVLAAEGYPGKPVTGEPIEGLEAIDELEGVEAFHAGTAMEDGRVVTAGGRVLGIAATGVDLRAALQRAYDAAALVRWPHRYMRRDIGRRVLEALPGED
ncbi:MAG: phosphoribosylamine--glycine ligase [Thermoanaerobaculia bacterium]|nr:phosphoribosylamine--glycine ligase [Thermoanaerobaculia bacterium]